ncbi:MAG: IspD/TarI family cytidylyltransferase [Sumerlaeia bacterium]
MENDDVGLVVVAAGKGTRFGRPKQFVPLGSQMLLLHCLRAFERMEFREWVVVLPPDLIESGEWEDIAGQLPDDVKAVPGGAERADSVRVGVAALSKACGIVAVHDGARPFPPLAATREAIAMLRQDATLHGVIVASPVTDTLKFLAEDGSRIANTIDRSRCARAETPQVCRRESLLRALEAPGAERATDEGQALERIGLATAVKLHQEFNLKITSPEDLRVAETLLR